MNSENNDITLPLIRHFGRIHHLFVMLNDIPFDIFTLEKYYSLRPKMIDNFEFSILVQIVLKMKTQSYQSFWNSGSKIKLKIILIKIKKQ